MKILSALLFLTTLASLPACGTADASPVDGGAAPTTKKSDTKKADGVGKDPDGGGLGTIGSSGVGVGRGSGYGAYPECMSAEEAKRKGTLPDGERVGRMGGRPGPGGQSKDVPECPMYIWTYVGSGHGAQPVGNVQAPLGTAATRKERKKHEHNCCYMIPPVPGRPNG